MPLRARKSVTDVSNHNCTLPQEEDILVRYISGGYFVMFRRWIKRQTMVWESNPRSKMYLKSTFNIRREKIIHLEDHYYMIHPFSSMKCYWEFMMIIAITLMLIIVPIVLCWEHVTSGVLVLRITLDILCFIDILIGFQSGYLDDKTKKIILSQKKVAMKYLKGRFLTDFLPLINSDIMSVFMESQSTDSTSNISGTNSIRFMNIIKILRIFTLTVYMNRLREFYQYSIFRFKMFKLLLITFLLLLWATGVLFVLARESEEEWLINPDDENYLNTNLVICFVEVFDFFFLIDHYPTKSLILLPFELAALAVGVVLQMYFISQILQLVEKHKTSENKYNDKNIQLHNYVRNKQVPPSIASKCQDYFDFKFQKSYYRESEILQTLSTTLRSEINSHICERLLENVDILKDMPFSVITMLTGLMEEEIYLPNDIITRAGDIGDCMYFISSGMVAVYTPGGKEICHISNGGNFGEVCMIMKHTSRVATVIAVDYCDLYVLSRKCFLSAIKTYPDLYRKTMAISKKRMSQVVQTQHGRYRPEEFYDMRTPEGVFYFKKSLYEL
ncbi:potassium/sodium hyperpolarization-activated cyclic nucleotide-gated channel 1-like [Onthophagus taurus]|uniref:potassium/sodium hyperpolarization-activated cyclic nucleotide-gated channel 1-like n=1 Tax=Onthophagus taurus TaxID=166361 RepID=UPI0039BE0723